MKIGAISAINSYSSINKINSKVAFKESYFDREERNLKDRINEKYIQDSANKLNEDYKNRKHNNEVDHGPSVFAGFGVATLIALLVAGAQQSKIDNQKREFTEKAVNLIESGDVKTDELIIKDVTKDGQADFILTKQDSSKIVIDAYNSTILEEKKLK